MLIGGSIWPADIACLRSVLLEALEELPELRLILVPHEPTEEHVSEIKEIFSSYPIHLWSQGQKDEFAKARVLIVDEIGIFSSLYAKVNLAVGGAFTTGVHNIMELHLDYQHFLGRASTIIRQQFVLWKTNWLTVSEIRRNFVC